MMIYIGFTFSALIIGFIIGASNTPVVGSFITAIFGFLGVIVGSEWFISKSYKRDISSTFIGICSLLISLSIVSGLFIGEAYRKNKIFSVEKEVPWTVDTPPENTKEAIDWLLLKEKIIALGYTDETVSEIYQIRLKEIKKIKQKISESDGTFDSMGVPIEVYDESSSFNGMISLPTRKIDVNRGPSSIIE